MSFNIYHIIICGVGSYMFLFSLMNILYMQKNRLQELSIEGPLVSVLIPARDEEAHIGNCLRSLLDQRYRNYEIIVLDDESSDSTWDIINAFASRSKRVTAVRGKALPDGWNGKTHALHQLQEAASGDILLFTDADTIHSPDSIAFAAAQIIGHGTDLVTGYPRQLLSSISCAAVITAMHFNIMFISPLFLQRKVRNPAFGLAIGQYIAVRASSLEQAGGFYPIRSFITDDIHLSRLFLQKGFSQLFLDIGDVVSCRMYDTFSQSFHGISRSIIDFFDRHLLLPLLAVPLVLLILVIPTFLLCYLLITGQSIPILLITGVFFMHAAWFQTVLFLRYSLKTLLLFCPTMLLIVVMFVRGLFLTLAGRGFQWKERTVR